MVPRRVRRPATVLTFAAAVLMSAAAMLGASSTTARADNSPPSQVLSNFENHYAANLVRDCGYSQPLPANPASSLWLFCDTDTYGFNSQKQWQLTGIINGSTAAEGPATPGAVPAGISELTTPGTGVPAMPNNDGPAQFLPAPAGLVTSAGQPCDSANNAYAASWISGVTRDAARSSDVLISYDNYCVPGGGGNPLAEGFGLAEYNPAANTLDSQATVFTSASGPPLAQQELLGAPVFSGGYLYLFASRCADVYDATCVANGGNAVYLARVSASPSAWAHASGYLWRAGPAWTGTAGSATSVISGATPLAVNVASFAAAGQGLVLIEETNLVGAFTVYEASGPTGTWTQKTSGTVPCTAEGNSFCRAIIGHPELSTTSQLLVSFFNPGAAPYYNPSAGAEGHVMVAAFAW